MRGTTYEAILRIRTQRKIGNINKINANQEEGRGTETRGVVGAHTSNKRREEQKNDREDAKIR